MLFNVPGSLLRHQRGKFTIFFVPMILEWLLNEPCFLSIPPEMCHERCSVCDEALRPYRTLLSHFIACHARKSWRWTRIYGSVLPNAPGPESYFCLDCLEGFESVYLLILHISKEHEGRCLTLLACNRKSIHFRVDIFCDAIPFTECFILDLLNEAWSRLTS